MQDYPTSKDLTYQLEYDGTTTPTTETWTYSVSRTQGGVGGPDGAGVTNFFNDTSLNTPDKGLAYKTVNSDGTQIERIWQSNSPPQGNAYNPFVKTEFTSVKDAAGNLSKTTIKDYNCDKNGNITRVAEYDWVDYNTVPRTNGKPAGIPAGAVPIRVMVNTYYSPTPDSANVTTNDPDIYANPLRPRFRTAIESTEVQNSSGQASSRSENYYDDSRTTGNLITQRSWDSTKGVISRPLTTLNSISATHQYDAYGNPALNTDANGNQTQLTYGPINGVGGLYPTQVKTAYLTSIERTTTQSYDFYKGVMTLATDVNNNVSTKTSYDVFARPTLVQEAYQIAGQERQTSTQYSDGARRVIVRRDLNTTGDQKLVTIQHYDQIGRVRLSRQLEDASTESATDETKGIKVQTRYRADSANQVSYELVSNPYRVASADQTMGWARTKRDNGGRVVETQTFSGAGLPRPWGTNNATTGTTTTSYDGIYTTVTDQASKARRSKVDGLGRLSRVDETTAVGLGTVSNPNQKTDYGYDALGNLTGVTQGTQPARSFQYTSLSRVKTATNPESGTVNYEYDNNGNLKRKTDARGTQTNCNYDALNRVTSRSYANDPAATPSVSYAYDAAGVLYSKGRLTQVSSSVSVCDYTEYDALGRIKQSRQTTGGQPYSMSYSYNLAGGMTSQNYPSGTAVQTEYDAAGRMAGVKNVASGTYYAGANASDAANRIQYAPHGAITAMRMSNGAMREQTSYNARLQATQIELRKAADNSVIVGLDYGYGATASVNNGNVSTQTVRVGASTIATQSYTYDELNRLSAVNESNTVSGWQQTYDYDRWGNRAVRAGSYILNTQLTPQSAFAGDMSAFNAANNRIALSGYSYDVSGNAKSDPTTLANAMVYDGENRIVSYTKGGGTTSYSYNGDGKRVKKVDSSGTTVYVYNAGGQLVAEYTTGNGTGNGTSYLTMDTLGSTRVVTRPDGIVKARYDYLPFGEEIGMNKRPVGLGYGGSDSTKQKFTSKERDTESGLDYFGARYYAAAQGRFTSVDPVFFQVKMATDPQRLNSYAYARNNPLLYVDPTGEAIELLGNEEDRKKALAAIQQAVGKEAGQYLYINEIDGKYYVGIITNGGDGNEPKFEDANEVAGEIAPIIRDSKVVRLQVVPEYFLPPGGDETDKIGSLKKGYTSGATGDYDGGIFSSPKLTIYILDPSTDLGKIPGRAMSDNKDSQLDQGLLVAHELGHARARMTGDPDSAGAALRLENKARKLRDPNAPTRKVHDLGLTRYPRNMT